MDDMTDAWWKNISGESISQEEKIRRLQKFFADNGEAIYGKPKTEKTIKLENISSTVPERYTTSLSDLDIVPMWAGKEIGWSMQ